MGKLKIQRYKNGELVEVLERDFKAKPKETIIDGKVVSNEGETKKTRKSSKPANTTDQTTE